MKLKKNQLVSLKIVGMFTIAKSTLNHPKADFSPSISPLQSSEGASSIGKLYTKRNDPIKEKKTTNATDKGCTIHSTRSTCSEATAQLGQTIHIRLPELSLLLHSYM